MAGRGYTGHLHNDEVGLIYMNARYYVPSLGRFASADTIVPDMAHPQSFNRYSYVQNNPLYYTDPSGHFPWLAMAGGAAVGALVGAGIEYGLQVHHNMQNNMSFQDALTTNIDVGKIAGGAATGAIVGGTFGVVGPTAAAGYGTMMLAGAASNAVAGQAAPVITASTNELLNNGIDNFDSAGVINTAQAQGFGSWGRFATDAVAGAVAGVVGKATHSVATELGIASGILPSQQLTIPNVSKIQFGPVLGQGVVAQITTRPPIEHLTPPIRFAAPFLQALLNKGINSLSSKAQSSSEGYIEGLYPQ